MKISEVLPYQPSKADLAILREWIKKTPHIVQDYDDEFLATFVRGCKGSLQKTKLILENFNSLGLRYPDFFGHLDVFDPLMQENLKIARMFPLPKKTEDGEIIFICTQDFHYKGDPYKFHALECIRYWLMSMYVINWENESGTCKVRLVTDGTNCSVAYFRDITPMRIKNVYEMLETSLPIRLQAVHDVNLPPFVEWMINFGKTVVKAKIIDRIHIHSDLESLHRFIRKDILPKEFGGNEADIETLHARFRKKVEGYSERLKEESNKMRKLDSIRPKTDAGNENVGTFRFLNVD